MRRRALTLAAAFCALPPAVHGRIELPSKHGLAVTAELEDSDAELLTSKNSPISWYFNWSPSPSEIIGDSAFFIPLVHGLDTLEEDYLWLALDNLPSSSTHLFTFNEPDEEKENGGSNLSPRKAAEAYLEYMVPLRTGDGEGSDRRWNISHPAVTGSTRGLDWLRDFNESCYDIEPNGGCPADFVSLHYYGDFQGLASWVATLNEFYNNDREGEDAKGLWITEMAVPQGDSEVNTAMLRESMEYLDGLANVDGYAWFGAFREEESNEWTGEGVSLLDDDGDLTDVGREYMGGETSDFQDDDNGDGDNGGGDQGDEDDDSGCNILQPNIAAILLVLIGAVALALG